MSWIPAIGRVARPTELGAVQTKLVEDSGYPNLVVDYQRAFDWMIALDDEPADELPDNLREDARAMASILADAGGAIRAYTLSDPTGRENLTRAVQSIQEVLQWWRANARQQIRSGVVDYAVQAEAVRKLQRESEAAHVEATNLLSRVRELVDNAGTGELAVHYSRQVQRHRRASVVALVVVWVLATAVVLVGWWLVDNLPRTDDWATAVQNIASRAFIVGALSFGVAFASRIYRTNVHLRAVYEQKTNALMTFPLFSQSVDDDEVRTMILGELVRSVFSQTDTGALGSTTDHTIVESAVPLATAIAAARSVPLKN